jgi:hypothetical protein
MRCVVIEDDVQRREDPRVRSPAAFLGDRVVHWCDVYPGGGQSAAGAIEQGAFGYPLNAFVVSRSSKELGLIDGEEAPRDLPPQVKSSLMAVIVSAFDATSFTIWTLDAQ